ncbi:hypothetical protein Dimus_031155 [Dionaea muscipula]
MAAVLSTSVFISTTTQSALSLHRITSTEQNSTATFTNLTCLNEISRSRKKLMGLSVKAQATVHKEVKADIRNKWRSGGNVVFSDGRDGDESYGFVCPGCGIYMQDKDPNLPGYYKKRKEVVSDISEDESMEVDDFLGEEGDFEDSMEVIDWVSENEGAIDSESEEWEEESEDEVDDDMSEFDGFAAAGVGYGNATVKEEEELGEKKKIMSKSERKRLSRMAQGEAAGEEVTVCARCHSLRNYGQVKNEIAENLIPDFDFNRLISTRLLKPSGKSDSTVVVMVVDCVDFDGSFPKRAARSLFKALALEEGSNSRVVDGAKTKSSKTLPKLVLVATKVDLLPSQISPARLDRWVRRRAKALGAPKLNGVYLVSARKDLGVRNLLSFIKELAGPRGNVWIVGAQNAGKSTLINTFAKKQGAKITRLTEASVPGTTIGILRIGGILPGNAKMYDTPGLLHPYLMSVRLSREEQKMIEIRKELQPRTYRIKVGQTIHVGGLMRLDLCKASVETIYVTICVSQNISLHLGKTENANETWRKHVAVRLQPPVSTDRVSELGDWKEREFKVSGTGWDVNSCDIVVAGLGWCSLGLKGDATLKVWTYQGVELLLREPLVIDRAPSLERTGFWLPKALCDAIGSQSKLEAKRKQQLEEENQTPLLDVTA